MQATRARGVLRFEEGDPTDLGFLGGKGASLVRMRSLGLPVPPGIVVGTPACARYEEEGRLPDDIWAEILEQLHEVELEVGRSLGDVERPLLLSVRSGAPVSMPGMMDTILDIGLCTRTLPGVAALAGDVFAWDTYARLVRMFGQTVSDIPSRDFESARLRSRTTVGKTPPRVLAKEYLAVFEAATGRPFPDEPLDQLREAVEAVFRSWQAPRAQRYRAYAGISEALGTAVVVQAMVFGNMDARSGTGVAFTRDPAIGTPGLYGDFLLRAQGEDVVAGHQDPSDIDEFRRLLPEAFDGLVAATPVLERSYGDMCDIEFTVEHGRFWLLQARRGQRTAHAAVRIALDLVEEGLVDLDTAVRRIPPSSLIRIRDPRLDDSVDRVVLGRGLAASPGSAVGRVALSAAAAERMAEEGDDVVLVRPYTSPDDIAGFIAARGIVTIHGGRTSHAAVVARGMDRPAVCGVKGLSIGDGVARFPGGEVAEGDEISVDGSSGQVFLGRLPLVPALEDPRVATLLAKADASRSLPVLVHGRAEPWADGVLPVDGTQVCASVEELDDAADDRSVLRVVLDLGAASDPAALLAHAESLVAEGEPQVLVLVDERWPTTVRSLPRIAWAGLVAGRQGDWTARLLAALMTEAS
jgi:pyruvate,orthophosphate dikinase